MELMDARGVIEAIQKLDARMSKMERRFWILCAILFAAEKVPLEKLLTLLAP